MNAVRVQYRSINTAESISKLNSTKIISVSQKFENQHA